VIYCERYTAACGEWTEETSCADWWAASPAGTEGDAAGATQACYSYHLSVAEMQEDGSAERTEHCGHSMGMAPCVDPEPTYCERYATACGEWTAETPCADWWAASAVGTEGDTSGATQACYSYHLSVAEMQADGSAERTEHCGHSMGMAPCVD
jgi:hypothetical protein